MAKENKSNIIIYQSEDGQTHIEVQMDEDTVWLSQTANGRPLPKRLEQMW